ncbi:MAG: exodeoxyribonuclease VII small subunit [Ignavibacteriales bacterium]
MAKKKNEDSFEESLRRLEEISGLLDKDEIGLDEAICLYEEGIELSKLCFVKLKEAELKITTLRKNLEDQVEEEGDFQE